MIQTAYPNLRNGLTRLNITLGKIRSIHITIIGATKPGNYTVSSLTTLFNSLFICGGPDSINTFREIELIRNNKVAHRIDLYQFLSKGDLSGNVLLSENDVINFPVYKKRVTLSGEVKRKGIFELLEAETMDKLLFYAGGFTNSAFTASIKVKQVTETDRRVRDIPKSEYLSYRPANGDEIIVEQIPERIENAVTISGSVFMPGAFEFSEGLTAGALIKKAGGLREDAFPDRGMITRTRDDKTRENIPFKVSDMVAGKADILLKKQDEIQISSSTAFRSEYTVFIEGEVRKAGYYPYKDNLSVKDILFLAGSFTDAATSYNIAVSRRITTERAGQPADSIARVFFINTGKDLSFTGDAFILQPFDIVTVRRNPGYNEQKRVTINGEIMYPGLYTISTRQERLSDLFKKAGGLTPSAYIQGVSLTRKVKESLKLNDTIRKKNIAMMQSGIKDLNSKVIRDVDATTVKIAVNMDKILAEPGSEDDYILEEGDVINIAKFDPLVKLSGEVLLGTKVNYEAGRSMKYYLNRAGGITDNARLSKIYVVYANGQLDKTDSHLFGLIRSYPKIKAGAEIVVPAKSPRRGLSAAETVGITSAIVSIFAVVVVTLNSISK
jgi:protein involved in polysaccharide export with SLBB domain